MHCHLTVVDSKIVISLTVKHSCCKLNSVCMQLECDYVQVSLLLHGSYSIPQLETRCQRAQNEKRQSARYKVKQNLKLVDGV